MVNILGHMGSETSGLMIGRCLRDDRAAAELLAKPRLVEPRPPRSGLLLLSRPGVVDVTFRVEMGGPGLLRVEPVDIRRDADGEGGFVRMDDEDAGLVRVGEDRLI